MHRDEVLVREALSHVEHIENVSEKARRLGVGASSVTRWLAGEISVPLRTARAPLEAFLATVREKRGDAEAATPHPGFTGFVLWSAQHFANFTGIPVPRVREMIKAEIVRSYPMDGERMIAPVDVAIYTAAQTKGMLPADFVDYVGSEEEARAQGRETIRRMGFQYPEPDEVAERRHARGVDVGTQGSGGRTLPHTPESGQV